MKVYYLILYITFLFLLPHSFNTCFMGLVVDHRLLLIWFRNDASVRRFYYLCVKKIKINKLKSKKFKYVEKSVKNTHPGVQQMEKFDVTLNGMHPTENDFFGIKTLLTRLFMSAIIDYSLVTEFLITEHISCSVLKILEDADSNVYGVVGLYDIRKNHQISERIKKFVLEKAKRYGQIMIKKLTRIFSNDVVLQLVNERFINIPSSVSPACIDSLWQDFNIYQHEYGQRLLNILVVSKAISKLTLKQISEKGIDNFIPTFINEEDKLFYTISTIKIIYDVTDQTGYASSGKWSFEDQEYRCYRIISFITTKDLEMIKNKLTRLIKEPFLISLLIL